MRKKARRVVVPLSGGLDSAALLVNRLELGYDVFPLFINYGHRAAEHERWAARKIVSWARRKWSGCVGLQERQLPLQGVTRGAQLGYLTGLQRRNRLYAYTPGRNTFLAVVAMLYAADVEAEEVSFAFVPLDSPSDRPYADAGQNFVYAMSALSLNRVLDASPSITTPFLHTLKGDLALLLKAKDFDFSWLWTCSSGAKVSCGVCGSCHSLYRALKYARVVGSGRTKSKTSRKAKSK